MVSKTELKKDKKGKRDRRLRGRHWFPAIAGGIVGSALTCRRPALRGAAVRQQPDRPAGPARQPANPCRSVRRTSRPAVCTGPRRHAHAARNAVRLVVERRRKARGRAGRILRLRLPLLQSEQSARRPADPRKSGPSRRLPRASDPRRRQRRCCPPFPRSVQGRPVPAVPRCALRRRTARARHECRRRPHREHFASDRRRRSDREPRSRRTSSSPASSARRARPCSSSATGCSTARSATTTLKKAVEDAQKKRLLEAGPSPIAGNDRRSRRRSVRSVVDHRKRSRGAARRGRPGHQGCRPADECVGRRESFAPSGTSIAPANVEHLVPVIRVRDLERAATTRRNHGRSQPRPHRPDGAPSVRRRAQAVTVEGQRLFVPSAGELIALLRSFGRPKDLVRASTSGRPRPRP